MKKVTTKNDSSYAKAKDYKWVETTLGEVALNVAYGYTESSTREKVGPKFLRITDIQEDFIDWKNVPYCPISEKDHQKYKLEIGDIVIARTGNSTGATATIKQAIDAVFASYLIRFKIDSKKADFLFIDFLLRSDFWKGFVKSVKGGSAQGGANARNFAEFPITLPPLPEQRAIAAVLSSLDDKIELLREQNKTMEETAQVVFREWFGKYGVEDELPEGWRVGRLGDVLELSYGKALKTEDRTGNGFPVYGSNGVVGFHEDFLVKGHGIIVGRKGTIGSVIWCNEDFFPIDTAFYVKDRIGVKDLYFHYFLLKKQNFEKIGSDSAVPGLNRDSAYSIEITIPTNEIIQKFSRAVTSVFEKIKNNTQQIQTLFTLRDTLLPRLMRGDVRVNF